MNVSVLVIVSVCVATVFASPEGVAFRMGLKLLDECSRSDFRICMKKKAITFLDRLGRMEKITIMDGFTLIKSKSNETNSTIITENDIDENLGRSLDDKNAVLNKILVDKATSILDSRTMQIFIPKASKEVSEGRSDEHHGHWTTETYWAERRTTTRRPRRRGVIHVVKHMMATAAAATTALTPLAIGLVGLIAAQAFIIAKIALVIAIIIAVRKFLDSQKKKPEHPTTPHTEWHSSGWETAEPSPDRRISEAHRLAYKGYRHLHH
ncbi:hypothetical protein GWI33_013206 [Rhynchophorus ferrugineus]|uniref:Uncharacterized protein n=1 Tax=Rhynchophorus ferrugineus TaxID=354439 RepID=A0A834I466_RHYFE|nr:hypothetical protein GWI33_013206 [Rhynchophorus ferrugineus]